MTASLALVQLRLREIRRTWRLWVLPAVMVGLAASGPPAARFVREILSAALGGGDAVQQLVAEPTAFDANIQWAGNLTQMIVFVVVIMAAGAMGGEIASGVAAMTLVKPVSHTAYVLTHAGVLLAFTTVCALAGAGVSALLTLVLFGEVALGALLAMTGVWLVFAAVLMGGTLLASVKVKGVAGASGVGIGLFFALVLLGLVPALGRYSPAGLISLTNAAATGAMDASAWWPLLTGVLLAGGLLAAAVAALKRREL